MTLMRQGIANDGPRVFCEGGSCLAERDDGMTMRSRVYALSIHADYKCRHSGACCTADWDVPVELPLYKSLDEALTSSRLAPAGVADQHTTPLIVEDDLPDDAAAMVARTSTGDCVFYHRHSGLCVVHRDLGEAMLPATCRHFPRLAVRDADRKS